MRRCLLALVILFMGVVLPAAGFAHAQVIEQILVKVNGEVFSQSNLEEREVAALRQRGQNIDLRSAAGDQQLRKTLDELLPRIMVDAINEMIIVQRGKELGFALSDDQFKSAVEGIRKDNNLVTEEDFQRAIKNEGLTVPDLRRLLERDYIVRQVQQREVLGRIGVTEEEARKYYDSHLPEFTTPATVTLRQIQVTVPADPRGVNAEEDMAARMKAEQARERVLAGETFEQVAAQVSVASNAKDGGLMSPIVVSDIAGALKPIIEALKVGEMTDVLRTVAGYQIYKLEASTPTDTMPFEQARQRISERVFTDKRSEEFRKYLEKLRSQAIIEWKNDDVKRAFEVGLKQQDSPQSSVDSQQSAGAR